MPRTGTDYSTAPTAGVQSKQRRAM